jgi:hypothetical protein
MSDEWTAGLNIDWSGEVPFEQSGVDREVPEEPGVYQILQNEDYSRYKGETRVLKIGKSDGSLRKEIANHFVRHTAANRLARVRNRPGIEVSIVFAVLPRELTAQAEAALLRKFEDDHWDLPVLNSQRGYGRNDDVRYRR